MSAPESLLLLACLVTTAALLIHAKLRDAQRVIDEARAEWECYSRSEIGDFQRWETEIEAARKHHVYDWKQEGL